MMRCIIIDDETQSRIALRDALQPLSSTVKIIAEANSVLTAMEAIENFHPDLIFLDIRMGDGSGFDVLEKTNYKNYKTIFLTAYDQYAVDAFRAHAVDYLLKPINHAHLAEAVEKSMDINLTMYQQQLQLLIDYLNKPYGKMIFATNEGYNLYEIDNIIRCESDNNYCRIYFTDHEKLYVAKTLKDLEEQLTPFGFERVHQSHLINMKHVKKYLNKDGGCILLSNGDTVPVAQRKKTYLLDLLQQSANRYYSK